MDRLASYEMFVAIAREGSLTAAARRLGLSAQAVTRGLAALEDRLAVRLFHRTTRAVSLTAEGAGHLPRIERLLRDLAESERELLGSLAEPHGELAITAPVMFGQLHVMPVVTELLAQYPALDIRLLLLDRNVRLIEEGIDVALRIGELPDSALRAVKIGSVREVIVASPGYLARKGHPASLADLAGHDLIASTGPRGAAEWRFGSGDTAVRASRRLKVNTVSAALTAAEDGVGLANFLSYQAAEALASGRLIEVLRPAQERAIPIHLLFEAGRANSAATRLFIDAMRLRGARGF
jgi:DNA-binding transcriptional LysR family regulator